MPNNEIKVQSPEILATLYTTIDELGLSHDYSLENGELNVKFGEAWVSFYLDHRIMEEMKLEDEAFEDAQRIAEGYWRQ